MKRYVICFRVDKENNRIYATAYQISEDTEVEDISVPDNTVWFVTAKSEKNAKEIAESFVLLQIGAFNACNVDGIITEGNTLYCIGKEKGGYVINSKTHIAVQKFDNIVVVEE